VAVLGDKLEVLRNFTTRRQCTPLRRHTFDVPTQLNLFDEERIASFAVLCAFIWVVGLVGFSQLLSRPEGLRVRHEIRLLLKTVPQVC